MDVKYTNRQANMEVGKTQVQGHYLSTPKAYCLVAAVRGSGNILSSSTLIIGITVLTRSYK